MGRTSPIRQKLVEYLRSVLVENQSCGKPIPTVRAMAYYNGVAYQTMWKAVDRCRQQGILTASPRRGVQATGATVSPDLPRQHTSAITPDHRRGKKWEIVRDALRHSLIEGAFMHSPKLPSMKALCEQFGASYPVMRSAMVALLEEKTLEICRGGYRPVTHTNSGGGGTVVLVSGALRSGPHSGRVFARNWDLVRSLEISCSASFVNLDILDDPLDYRKFCTSSIADSISGFIVWAQGLEPEEVTEIVIRLANTGKPIAVLDESGAHSPSTFDSPQSLVQLFTLGVDADCGHVAGVFLRELGHRRVAYFSALENDNRHKKMREALETSGHDAMRTFMREEQSDAGLPKPFSFDDFLVLHNPAGPDDSTWMSAHEELLPHADAALQGIRHYHAFMDYFEEALNDTSITAWVGASELIAIQCLRYLRSKGISVPQQLTVIGFDDTIQSTLNGLSSFNFNVGGLAHAIVGHVIHPEMRREKMGTPNVFVAKGRMTIRASSGPVFQTDK